MLVHGLWQIAFLFVAQPQDAGSHQSPSETERLQREVVEKIATISKLKKEIESLKSELSECRSDTRMADERLSKFLREQTAAAPDGVTITAVVSPTDLKVIHRVNETIIHYRIVLPARPAECYMSKLEKERLHEAEMKHNAKCNEKSFAIATIGSDAQLGIYGEGERRRRWTDKLIKDVNAKFDPEISTAEDELARVKSAIDARVKKCREVCESINAEFRFSSALANRTDLARLLKKDRFRISGAISAVDVSEGPTEVGNAPHVSSISLTGIDATE